MLGRLDEPIELPAVANEFPLLLVLVVLVDVPVPVFAPWAELPKLIDSPAPLLKLLELDPEIADPDCPADPDCMVDPDKPVEPVDPDKPVEPVEPDRPELEEDDPKLDPKLELPKLKLLSKLSKPVNVPPALRVLMRALGSIL